MIRFARCCDNKNKAGDRKTLGNVIGASLGTWPAHRLRRRHLRYFDCSTARLFGKFCLIVASTDTELPYFGLGQLEPSLPLRQVGLRLLRSLLHDADFWLCRLRRGRTPLSPQVLAVCSKQAEQAHFLKARHALAALIPLALAASSLFVLINQVSGNVEAFVSRHSHKAFNSISERLALFMAATGAREV
jgi:hypothetical protein